MRQEHLDNLPGTGHHRDAVGVGCGEAPCNQIGCVRISCQHWKGCAMRARYAPQSETSIHPAYDTHEFTIA